MYVQGLQWEKIFLPSIFMTPYDVGSGGNQGGVGRKCSHTPTVAVFGMMATESGAPTENWAFSPIEIFVIWGATRVLFFFFFFIGCILFLRFRLIPWQSVINLRHMLLIVLYITEFGVGNPFQPSAILALVHGYMRTKFRLREKKKTWFSRDRGREKKIPSSVLHSRMPLFCITSHIHTLYLV